MRTFNLACAGVAVGGLVFSTVMWRELYAQRELVAQWQQTYPEFVPESARRRSAAKEATSVESAQVAVPVLRPNPVAPAPDQAAQRIIDQNAMRDPRHRANALMSLRQIMPHAHPDLAEELGLTPDEASRLFDLLAEQQLEISILMSAPADGASTDPAVLQDAGQRGQELNAQHEMALASFLGDASYEKWKGYKESRRARQQVVQYAGPMSAMGQPLSSEQEVSLRAALVAEDGRQRAEMQKLLGSRRRTGPLNVSNAVEEARRRRAESHSRIIAAAEPHLTAEQLESLRDSLAQELAASRVSVRSR